MSARYRITLSVISAKCEPIPQGHSFALTQYNRCHALRLVVASAVDDGTHLIGDRLASRVARAECAHAAIRHRTGCGPFLGFRLVHHDRPPVVDGLNYLVAPRCEHADTVI